MAFGETTRGRLALFGGLYFAQGISWGFVAFALPVALAGRGFVPAELGSYLALVSLAWAVGKPLMGLLSDRLRQRGHAGRRPLVLVAQGGMLLSLCALAAADAPRVPRLLGVLAFVHNLFVALQDVGTDGLAIDLLRPDERGRANGVTFAAKFAGTAAGGSGLVYLGSHAGWVVEGLAAAALLMLPALPILGVRERPATSMDGDGGGGPRPAARLWLTRAALVAVPFALVANLSDSLLTAMQLPLFLQLVGGSAEAMSALGLMGQIAGTAGALGGGYLSDRLGRRRTLAGATVGIAVVLVGLLAARPWWGQFRVLAGYTIVSGALSGMALTAAVALFMDLTDRRAGATQFQIYMSLLNLRTTWSRYAGGRLAASVSVPGMLVLGAVLELLPLPLLLGLGTASAKKPSPAGAPPS